MRLAERAEERLPADLEDDLRRLRELAERRARLAREAACLAPMSDDEPDPLRAARERGEH